MKSSKLPTVYNFTNWNDIEATTLYMQYANIMPW